MIYISKKWRKKIVGITVKPPQILFENGLILETTMPMAAKAMEMFLKKEGYYSEQGSDEKADAVDVTSDV